MRTLAAVVQMARGCLRTSEGRTNPLSTDSRSSLPSMAWRVMLHAALHQLRNSLKRDPRESPLPHGVSFPNPWSALEQLHWSRCWRSRSNMPIRGRRRSTTGAVRTSTAIRLRRRRVRCRRLIARREPRRHLAAPGRRSLACSWTRVIGDDAGGLELSNQGWLIAGNNRVTALPTCYRSCRTSLIVDVPTKRKKGARR